jgi:signal peptidase I
MIFGILRVSGHSMLPKIKPRDLIIVSSIPYIFSEPKIGDTVLFRSEKKAVIKRIVKNKTGSYLVKGDNVADSKEFGWINRKDIIGKVIL